MSSPKGKTFTMVGLDEEMYDALLVAMRHAGIMKIGEKSFACISTQRTSGHMTADFQEIFFAEKPDPQWRGLQDGLPPVGAVCEYHVGNGPWFNCEIRYLITPISGQPKEVVIFAPHLFGEQVGVIGTGNGEVSFRPIRTPEQIAADERNAAIAEMCGDAGKPDMPMRSRERAAILYDAGWRKQAAP